MKKIFTFLAMTLIALIATAQDIVQLPEGAEVESYRLTYRDVNPSNESQYEDFDVTAHVAIEGDDVYMSGLCLTDDIWIKGTLSGSSITFPARQWAGNYQGTDLYLIGYTGSGAEDIVMEYDATTGAMYTTQYVLAIDDDNNTWDMMQNITLTPGEGQGSYEGIPDDATVYSYTLTTWETSDMDNPDNAEQYTYTRRVAFRGNDIWIQGLGYDESLWIQGTISGDRATFAKMQSGGNYGGSELYLIGYSGNADEDIVFSYDAQTGNLYSTDQYILLINSDGYMLGIMTSATLTRGGSAPTDEVVTPPEGLNPQPYVCKGSSIQYNADGSYAGMQQAAWDIRVAWSGSKDVYVQGLCSVFPEAWVKGTMDDGVVTFSQGQYFGTYIYPFYFAGQFVGDLSNFEMTYDASTRTFNGGGYYMVINSSKQSLAPFEVYAGVTFTPGEAASVPMAPQVGAFERSSEYFDGNGVVEFFIQPLDVTGHALNTEKLGYEILLRNGNEAEPITFSRSQYSNLPETEMTIIPYEFTDGWSFLFQNGVHAVELINVSANEIGVRAVYTGGDEVNRSEITWREADDASEKATAISQAEAAAVGEICTDLQGRQVSARQKGISIVTTILSDGTRQSRKVIRR